jgi:hypothetical protein
MSLIANTRDIRRKRTALHCQKGEQVAHLVGLNLVKRLFDYYYDEQLIHPLAEDEREMLVETLNEYANLRCESIEENRLDRHVEAELLTLLFKPHGSEANLSAEARLMLERAKALLAELAQTMRERGLGVYNVDVVARELERGQYPLNRQCVYCERPRPQMSIAVFCARDCLDNYLFDLRTGRGKVSLRERHAYPLYLTALHQDDNEDEEDERWHHLTNF